MIAQLAVMGGGSGGSGGGSRVSRGGLTLHRSNSSLELPHSPERSGRTLDAQPLRREYGSHGSIDVVAGQYSPPGSNPTGDHIFAMLQDFRSGRASADRLHPHTDGGLNAGVSTDEVCGPTSASSPKLRLKLNRLWGGKETNCPSSGTSTPGTVVSSDLEERHRRRAFLHYDTQSLTANLGYAAKLRGILLARRRNTATGASAASTLRSPTPDNDADGAESKDDPGDSRSNDLLETCPFFRNEIGGEGEREVALARLPCATIGSHRPSLAYGVSVLEPFMGESLWKHTCPLRKRLLPIESIDEGARYYRKYFLGKEHQNWFGMDEQLGPVAISVRKDVSHYRVIVRTSELLTLRGSIAEDALGLRNHPGNRIPTREILELVAPEVQIGCLRLGTQAAEEALCRLDEQGLSNRYKVGVLYCRAGQRTEEEMYNNQHAGPAFLEFLDTVGQRIRLRGFEGYKAGLDTRTDSTGTHAVAATHRGAQVTLHVVTMLPFTPNNRQQLLRKRHIGNDIVTIVFQEPGALPFSPKRIRSQFQHVFIIVKAINPCTENTQYCVAVSRSKEVPIFGPPVPPGAIFNKGKTFADFILAKVINAENAAHRSEKFSTMATRTRQEYLKDLAVNYSSTTLIETGQKFSMLSFSSKKKAPVRPRLACDVSQRGAICWQVILEESNQNTDCYLGISVDTIVLIEEHSRQIVFVSPCVNVLGWHAQTNSLRLYYHQGECISIHVRPDYSERDEIMEIVARLRAVTQGSPASELSLRRNSLGQLGFHVQPDGVVTQVESMGLSWQAGLRQGSRLVEICKVAVSTLSHDQMVDLLKTSAQVTVTVIPPTNDGQPRRGCSLQTCQYLSANYESDYENVSSSENVPSQQMAQQVQKNYERSLSPPRSSNSSGYGTGSSSRSFNNDPRFIQDNSMATTVSSTSASTTTIGAAAASTSTANMINSANHDERWYELYETPEQDASHRTTDNTPPPPLPARLKNDAVVHGKPTSESHKHYHHDYYSKEPNYVSPRVIHESNYQRLDDANRNHDESNYVRMQKDAGHAGYWYGHAKLSNSASLPLNQNSGYSKSVTTNGIRYDQVNGNEQGNIYDNDVNRIVQRKPKDYETRGEINRSNNNINNNINNTTTNNNNINNNKNNKNNKNDNYDERIDINAATSSTHNHESNGKLRERPLSSYEFLPNDCDKKNGDNIGTANATATTATIASTADGNRRVVTELNYDVTLQRDDCINSARDTSHEYLIGEKVVTCLKNNLPERVLTRKLAAHDYGSSRKDYSSTAEMRILDSTGSGVELSTPVTPSEDESTTSNLRENSSPGLRRGNKTHHNRNTGQSNHSPRNQSPRPRSAVRNPHRNSANLTSSTLQEDLMKLINPDYIADDNNSPCNSSSACNDNNYADNANNNRDNIAMSTGEKVNDGSKIVLMSNSNNNNHNNYSNNSNNINNELEIQNRCRSRENLCGTSTSTLCVLNPSSNRQDNSNPTGVTSNPTSEVILTLARPATVISNTSTNSSPAPSENKLTKEERLSPRVTKSSHVSNNNNNSSNNIINVNMHMNNKTTNNLNTSIGSKSTDESENEWLNCHADVSNAGGGGGGGGRITKLQQQHDQDWSDEKIYDTSSSVPDLQSHLSNLELRVARETRRRLSLEDEVRRLRDENRRLQDENHAAAQQLRRFTEWFFQTIDHQ